jgi:hypothetical protein
MPNYIEDFDKSEREGLVTKSADVSIQEVTDEELKKINKFSLEPLKAEDVFVFKMSMCDNETDDRNYEPFNLQSLKDMKKLYVGKTVIKDHSRRSDNQVARVYDTELVYEDGKLTKAGEPFARLVAKCYMIKTASNADLIADIKAGIKKEVSTSCRPKKAICSICGVDNMKTYCSHYWGKEYEKADGSKATCYFTLDGVKEAYEVSFVAVPAQPRAGTTKNYGGAPEKPENAPDNEVKETNNEKDLEANLKIRALESFIFSQKEEDFKNE